MPRNLQRSQKDDRELILQYLIQTSNEAIYWNQMANDRSSEMSKQLMAVGSVTIPLVGTFVAINNHLFSGSGYLIAFALLSIIASVLFGLIHLQTEAEFFNKYALNNANRSKSLYGSLKNRLTINEAVDRADNVSIKLDQQGNNAYFTIQSIFIGIGLLILSGVIVAQIFTQTNSNLSNQSASYHMTGIGKSTNCKIYR